MKKPKHIILLVSLLPLCLSCKNSINGHDGIEKKMDVEKVTKQLTLKTFKYHDLVDIWKQDGKSQFEATKKIDDFSFTATYKPASVSAMEEETDSLKLNDTIAASFKQKIVSYQQMHLFNFSIVNKSFKHELIKFEANDNQQYYDRLSYYSFAVSQDAYVIEDKDTLPCKFVNFERTFEANPSIMLTLVFNRKSTVNQYKNLTLVFDDKIFNKGKLMFDFETTPLLVLNYLKPIH